MMMYLDVIFAYLVGLLGCGYVMYRSLWDNVTLLAEFRQDGRLQALVLVGLLLWPLTLWVLPLASNLWARVIGRMDKRIVALLVQGQRFEADSFARKALVEAYEPLPQSVVEVRTKTGAGILHCKNALKESFGGVEEAVEILKRQGQA